MTNFGLIFSGVMALNVAVTFRSSEYYKKWKSSSEGLADSRNESGGSLAADGASSVSAEKDATSNRQWQALLRRYLTVYLLATLSDWLQGPYVYALYADYGFSQHDIAVLFVAGFGSSMIFGSFIGGMADWGGRRNFVVLFSIVYAASCITKHFKDFKVLMLGRLLGGVATSLLFSVFDAWLIRSHSDARLKQYLPRSFRWAAYGNSIVAIVAGLIANKAASSFDMVPFGGKSQDSGSAESVVLHIGGYLNPFDIALFALVLCGFFARFTWEENFGESGGGGDGSDEASGAEVKQGSASSSGAEDKGAQHATWYGGLRSAFTTTVRNTDILLCGIISSLFEGSMYIFVFMWTPALTEGFQGKDLPFGLIFSTFMVCCMAGSSLFSIFMDKYSGEQMAVGVFGVASASMAMIALSGDHTIKFLGMNLFEITVGMYFPIMGTMKGNIVPESKRAAIYNLYRIPLNFIVLFSLLTDLTPTKSFVLNTLMLGTASALQWVLMTKRKELVNALDSVSIHGETERLTGGKDSEA